MNPLWLKPTVHPAYPRLLCAHMRNSGYEMDDLFQGNSLDWNTLLSTQRFINFDQFRTLVRRAMDLSGCPWIGHEISSMIQVSSHGPLGYGALAAQTVRDAFKLVEWAMGTRIQAYKFELIEHDGRAFFEVTELFDPAELREFIYVMLLGSFQDMLAKASGLNPFMAGAVDIKVHFPFPRPAWHEQYALRFSALDVHFDSAQFTVDMPAAFLDFHCLTADEFAYRNAVRECEQLLAIRQEGGALSERIKNEFFALQPPYPSLEEMAQRYHCSARTLIRKLKQEGTSYQSLLDEVRKELACWYLQDAELTIEQVAEKLGFVDTSNFSRVFRRWLNCRPSEFRAHLN